MHRHPGPLLLTLLTLLVTELVAGPLAVQEAPADEVFGETIDVRVVNLEVVVTHDDERLTGLASDDFVLRVDGQEVPIEYFSEIRAGRAVEDAGARSGTDAVLPAVEPGQAVGQRYLVFIDEVFCLPNRRDRVLERLREDLPGLGPDDAMAVVAFDGDQVELLTSWSSSIPELDRTLRQAADRPSHGMHQRVRANLELDLDSFGGPLARRSRLSPWGSWRYTELSEVVDAATSTLRAFARPEGRKVMLLLSGEWPATYDLGSVGEARFLGYGFERYDQRLFAPLIDTANLLGYTLYPVEVGDVEGRFVDASYQTLAEADFAREVVRGREWNREGQLVDLARETGGLALLDGAALRPLERVQEDIGSYYSLGFTPDWRANDQRHRVRVELKGRGKVRVRRSFSDLSPRTVATLRLQSAQLFDLPLPGATRLEVSAGEPRDAGFRKVFVPLVLTIPLERATLLPVSGGWTIRLEVRVAVTDDRGHRSDIPMVPIALRLSERPEPGETANYRTELKMRERPHRVHVSVVDPVSGTEMSARLDVAFDD